MFTEVRISFPNFLLLAFDRSIIWGDQNETPLSTYRIQSPVVRGELFQMHSGFAQLWPWQEILKQHTNQAEGLLALMRHQTHGGMRDNLVQDLEL